MVAVEEEVWPLEALDGGHADAGAEEGILAVGFLGAAPARIAGQIEHRGEGLLDSRGSHLIGGSREYLLDQRGVPGAGQTESLGKTGGAAGHEPVQRLAELNVGDAQAGLLEQVSLHGVPEDRAVVDAEWVVRAAHLKERQAGALGVELPGGIEDFGGSVGRQLADLLFEGHSREQVGDPLLDGQAGISIIRRGFLCQD